MPGKMDDMLTALRAPGVGIEELPPDEIRVEGLEPPSPLFPRLPDDIEDLFAE
jgi:hypothetical protein